MWTPALESALRAVALSDPTTAAALAAGGAAPAPPPLPHGVVFAGFMVCLMIGSKLFETLVALRPVEHIARWVFVIASAALAVPIVSSNHNLVLAGFCVFEVACGVYFPSAGTMRSKYIPEEVRSTVMNVFRVGLNLIVVLVLMNIDALATDTVFLIATLLLTAATLAQHRLFVLSEQNSTTEERSRAGLEVGEEMDDVLKSKADASA
jgi:phage-related holin